MKESELYAPIKSFLSGLRYEVKSEIASCDIVAVRDDGPPMIVEMKTGFTLSLFQQASQRLRLSENVYIAVPRGKGKTWWKSLKENKILCRRLQIGLILVRMEDGFVEIAVEPKPYAPRRAKAKLDRLLSEFERREGDPNVGGITRQKLVTAYRQDATKCAEYLFRRGATKGSEVAEETSVTKATNIMAANHYGWFEKVERGVYGLTPAGAEVCEALGS